MADSMNRQVDPHCQEEEEGEQELVQVQDVALVCHSPDLHAPGILECSTANKLQYIIHNVTEIHNMPRAMQRRKERRRLDQP